MKARFVSVGIMTAFLALIGVADAGVRVPLEKVPPATVKGLRDRFPLPEIRFVDRETNGNYEFGMRQGERYFEVGIAADGKLVNVKEGIAEAKLPAPVKEAVQKKYPGAEFAECEKVIVGEGNSARVTFEVDLKDKGKKVAVVLDEAGKFLK